MINAALVDSLDGALLRVANEGNTRGAVLELIDAAADLVTAARRNGLGLEIGHG